MFMCGNCRERKPWIFSALQMRKTGTVICDSCESAFRLNRIAQRHGEDQIAWAPLNVS